MIEIILRISFQLPGRIMQIHCAICKGGTNVQSYFRFSETGPDLGKINRVFEISFWEISLKMLEKNRRAILTWAMS